MTPEVVERINRLLGGRAPQQRRLVAVPTILSVGRSAAEASHAPAATPEVGSSGPDADMPLAVPPESTSNAPPTADRPSGPERRWPLRRAIVTSITVLGVLAAVWAIL